MGAANKSDDNTDVQKPSCSEMSKSERYAMLSEGKGGRMLEIVEEKGEPLRLKGKCVGGD